MKLLKMHWSTRPISFLLSVLMALPVLALFLLQGPAVQAQAPRQPTWAVLDFANPSGYGSADVGRLAADSFVVEAAKLNHYTVLPREQLLAGIQNENMTPPLNLTSIERLGQSLGVDAIVAGEISSISFSRDRRQAKVSIAVRVIDPKSGFLLNGALAEGLSNPRPIPVSDEEQLVNEAFANAAFNAAAKISKFNVTKATVLIAGNNSLSGSTTTVTLNKGSRDGLYNGLDMVVNRGGIFVGTIRIADASDTEANAEITDLGRGIRPGDTATAIYHLPSFSVDKQTGSYQTATAADVQGDSPTPGTNRSALKGIGGVLIALVTAALLLSAIKTGNSDNSLGGAGVSQVTARVGRSSDLGGPAINAPVGYPSGAGFVSVSVKITANLGNINPSNFLEYHVYRSDSPAYLANPAAIPDISIISIASGVNTNTNGTTGTTGTTTGVVNTTGGLLGGNGFGQIPLFAQVSKNLIVYDDHTRKQAITASKPDPSNSNTLVTLTASTVGAVNAIYNVANAASDPQSVGIPGTQLNFGQRVSYAIESLYIQPSTYNTTGTGTINPGTGTNSNTNTNTNGTTNTSGTTTTTGGGTTNTSGSTNTSGNTNTNTGTINGHGQTFQLTGRRSTNTITYIEPVALTGGAVTSTGPTNVNITVPATAGANDYILQITTDPGFKTNVRTYAATSASYFVPNPQTNPTNFGLPNLSNTNGTAAVFNNINLNTDFPSGGSFFYRVGARDSADNGQANFDNPYVYSDPLSLPLTSGSLASRIHATTVGKHRPSGF